MKFENFFIVLVFLTLIATAGCGGGSGGDDDDDDAAEMITLSGTLGTGTVGGALVKSQEAASGYAVVAIDNDSGQTYRATSDSLGQFSIEVPSDSSYVLSVINEGEYVGPTVFDGSGTEVNTAIAPSANTDLGSITIDAEEGYARTRAAPDSVDTDVTVVAVDGKPFGAGDDGKVKNEDITSDDLREDTDLDWDGIPNVFDADEDNDGIRNGVASRPSGAEVVSDYVEAVFMSSNIWANHNTNDSAENLISLRLHVIPVEGQENRIASVQCIDIPSVIADVARVRWASSLGDPVDYPDENSLWSESSYGLYETTTLSDEQWIISIKPGAIMGVGDTFTIRVTYTDASYEDFFVATSYVLTDWTKIVSYNGTEMPEDKGVNNNPVEFNSNELVIIFSKPLDEDGNTLEGLSYSLIYGLTTCEETGCLVPGEGTTEEAATDNGETLSFTVPTETSGTYYITPVAEASGQRNGEETWFTRE